MSTLMVETSRDVIVKQTQKNNFKMLQSITLTELETAMLKRIQNLEVDGIGMGFSEFDGYNLTPQEKGVLSSLIQGEEVVKGIEGITRVLGVN